MYYNNNDWQFRPPFDGSPFWNIFGPPFGGPFGNMYGPPFGQPGPGMPPLPPPPPGGMQGGGPPGPPPAFVPPKSTVQQQGPQLYAIDPGAIRPCRFRYVYLWLTNGQQFWAWLVYVGKNSAAGWRWTGYNWMYFGVDLDNIDAFVCY